MNWWEEDRFTFFLYWLVEDKDYSAKSIVDVVDKPYHYKLLWDEYNEKENDAS
jgi:hypothetical protein